MTLVPFSVSNFRNLNFRDIQIKPLTVLMGSNGSGKSSLLELLLMLRQTRTSISPSNSCLVTNGPMVRMGATGNVFNKNTGSKSFQIGMQIPEIEFSQINKTFLNNLRSTIQREIFQANRTIETIEDIRKRNKTYFKSKSLDSAINKYNTLRDQGKYDNTHLQIRELLDHYDTIIKIYNCIDSESTIINYLKSSADFQYFITSNSGFNATLIEYEEGKFQKISDLLTLQSDKLIYLRTFIRYMESLAGGCEIRYTISSHNPHSRDLPPKTIVTSISYTFTSKDNRESFIINLGNNVQIAETKYQSIEPLVNLINRLGNFTSRNTKIFENITRPNFHARDPMNCLRSWLRSIEQFIGEQWSGNPITHIGPLRGKPERFYDSSRGTLNDQEALMVHLLRNDATVVGRIAKWLKHFEIEIEADRINETLTSIQTKKLIHVGSESAPGIDLADSGFGYSQVLPILSLCAHSIANEVVLIEQPEVHLHPNMQALLGDFFVEELNIRRNQQNELPTFLIETHSEALLRRILALIATDNAKEESEHRLSMKDIAVIFCSRSPDGASIFRMHEPTPFGGIDWPQGFRAEQEKTLDMRIGLFGDE